MFFWNCGSKNFNTSPFCLTSSIMKSSLCINLVEMSLIAAIFYLTAIKQISKSSFKGSDANYIDSPLICTACFTISPEFFKWSLIIIYYFIFLIKRCMFKGQWIFFYQPLKKLKVVFKLIITILYTTWNLNTNICLKVYIFL